MNYKLKDNASATGLDRGVVYTEKEINDLKAQGGVARLVANGAIEVTDQPATSQSDPGDGRDADNVTGSPPPLSTEPGKKEEARIQRSAGAIGDAAEKANPPTGARGTVRAANEPKK